MKEVEAIKRHLKVLTIASGKGGVGKTNTSLNLAMSLAVEGYKVLLMDADLGMANIDVMLNLRPRYDLLHVLTGDKTLDEIIIEGPLGVGIIPASSGVSRMANLDRKAHSGLFAAFDELERHTDFLIIDTAAGISNSVISFSSAASEVIVVVCDEPASFTDAYALIKVLNQEHGIQRLQILANMVTSSVHGKRIYSKLTSVACKFLNVSLGFLGSVPHDNALKKAVQNQTPVAIFSPHSPSAVAYQGIAKKLAGMSGFASHQGTVEMFLNRKKEKCSKIGEPGAL